MIEVGGDGGGNDVLGGWGVEGDKFLLQSVAGAHQYDKTDDR